MQLILASQSPRRQELLRLITSDFSVCPAHVDEAIFPNLPLEQEVVRLAHAKAQAVALQNPNAAVIGSDTLVVCDGQALGKPVHQQQAEQMLKMLSGRVHQVMTGLALIIPNQPAQQAVTITQVKFAPLNDKEIYDYIATGEPMDKAGAYGIQGIGARLIEEITGDYYSVMGLPVRRLYEMMRQAGLVSC